ncbi:uncharacterized protein LOC128554826 [Mercenaria mercenaria]|uniref:uncharacterized protein LOC128554826 n=1 Tax=Mercenaria mercenaria TaxID=6596 RepID=UPI00234E4A87|nr:uncharacterized protein LOC128554826 [Mercenaria mercenaria]
MASTPTSQQTTDEEGRNEFHRVISLQYECVTDVLRELLDYKLSMNNISLERYLRSCQIHLLGKKYVTQSQEELLKSPNPDSKNMDLTMLTMILLAKCKHMINITPREKTLIETLREHRNALAHNSTGRLSDNKLFTETSNDIMTLAKSLKVTSQNNLKACIDELKQRACVRIHSKLDIMEFNKEQLRVVLVHKEENGEVEDEVFSETLLKFNLTKWARQISRGFDVQKMLKTLQQQNVITEEVVKRIEDTVYECNKAVAFIEFLIKDGTKIQILKYCKQLRAEGQHLADLIEGKNTDGRETVDEIKKQEEHKLKEVLHELITVMETCEETCEAVHIYVEEKLGCDVSFSLLNETMDRLFGCTDKDGWYEGISIQKRSDEDGKKEKTIDDKVSVAAMSFEDYANYMGSQFRSIGEDICEKITSAIKGEALQMETFSELTNEELNECFAHYLGSKLLPFGIKKQLQRLQTHIKNQIKSTTVTVQSEGSLRKFDKPCLRTYEKCEVSYSLGGDQNIPAHEFVHPESSRLTTHYIVKKTVRFISACLNARKNGTIHFGIKRTGRKKGYIIGCENTTTLLESMDQIILNGIRRCFGHLNNHLQKNIIRCTRPVHIIHVSGENSVVVEIDIVPFDKHLADSFYSAMFPPNGPQREVFFLYEASPNCDIVEIERDRVEAAKLELKDAIRERQILDAETLRHYRSAFDLVQHLTYELTGDILSNNMCRKNGNN